MATYDENGNVIENEAQNTEIFIDTDNNFADHEYDTDGIIIEEDNTNDNEQVMDFTQCGIAAFMVRLEVPLLVE